MANNPMNPVACGNQIVQGPIVEKSGLPTRSFTKWIQDVQTRLGYAISEIGQIIGILGAAMTVEGHAGTVGTILQNLDGVGTVTANGVDFSRAYLNKTTDHIADGTGSPLAGGTVAHAALVASGPTATNALVYNGAAWVPAQIEYVNVSGTPTQAQSKNPATSQWLNGFSAATGLFSASQPAFSDIAGTAAATQIPALSALTGQITAAQLPASGVSGTINLAPLTGTGTAGSITVTNGLITAFVNPT